MPPILRWLLDLLVTNPIAVRLVQNGSRRSKHLYVRSIYLASLILVLLWILVANTGAGNLDYRALAAAGSKGFVYIAYLQIFLITVLSPVFLAGAIAQEANPYTWEIQLTTPMNRLQIVLGHLLGRLFFVLALLFASLPLFALTQYFGGVPGSSILASYLVAACAAIAVGSIAVSLAVSRIAGKRAVFTFYVAVITYLAITIALDQGIGAGGVTWFTGLNPFLALRSLLDPSGYARGGPGDPWMIQHPVTAFCTGALAISAILLTLSAMTVRGGGLQQIVSGGSSMPWYRRMFKLGAAGSDFRPPRSVWNNPIAWREAAARNSTLGRIVARWSFIALGALWGIAIVGAFHVGKLDIPTFRFILLSTIATELAVITLITINMAATAVSREREDGTLDLLLATPITPSAYLQGKLRGLIAYLLPLIFVPVGTLMLSSIYTLAGGLGRDGGVTVAQQFPPNRIDIPVVLPEAALLAPIVMIPFIAFCVMIGLHWSLKTRGTIGSVVSAFGVVAAIAGVVGLCGWKSGSDIQLIGPALAALSPASLTYAVIEPAEAMNQTIANGGLNKARGSLLIGGLIAGGAYLAIVSAMHANLVRGFDMTVRKLAGMK